MCPTTLQHAHLVCLTSNVRQTTHKHAAPHTLTPMPSNSRTDSVKITLKGQCCARRPWLVLCSRRQPVSPTRVTNLRLSKTSEPCFAQLLHARNANPCLPTRPILPPQPAHQQQQISTISMHAHIVDGVSARLLASKTVQNNLNKFSPSATGLAWLHAKSPLKLTQ